MKKPATRGTTAKHANASKHAATGKHAPSKTKAAAPKGGSAKVHAAAKGAKAAKPVALALAGEVACCGAEALAASLRLAGWPVGEEDVLALHAAAGGSADRGVTVPALVGAAMRRGLAGVRPVSFGPALAAAPGVVVEVSLPGGRHAVTVDRRGCWSWGERYSRGLFLSGAEAAWSVRWPAWL